MVDENQKDQTYGRQHIISYLEYQENSIAYREEIDDKLMQKIRYMDKLIDELA